MERSKSPYLDSVADALADRIEPVLMDEFAHLEGLTFEFDLNQWKALLLAVTEKIPGRLKGLDMEKEERLELLGVIDFLDRSVQSRGAEETAKTLFMTVVAMTDLLSSFRNFVHLKVHDRSGNDITEDVFG